MFYEKSPRHVDFKTAAAIVASLPPFLTAVGVFVDPRPEEVLAAIQACGLSALQFHGNESPEFCRQFGLRVTKAFRMKDDNSLEPLRRFNREAWLLDSFVTDKHGGTGTKFNWELASAARRLGGTIILAGGLTPDNVAEAVRQVEPYGVDVSSGVESVAAKKDPARMKAFVEAARST